MDREQALRQIIWQDQKDREAFSGRHDLPPWSFSMEVYQEKDPDILVAKITLASTLRWLGTEKLSRAEALKAAWDALNKACELRQPDGCSYWQREVARRRSAYFSDDGSQAAGVPRPPGRPPNLSNSARIRPD